MSIPRKDSAALCVLVGHLEFCAKPAPPPAAAPAAAAAARVASTRRMAAVCYILGVATLYTARGADRSASLQEYHSAPLAQAKARVRSTPSMEGPRKDLETPGWEMSRGQVGQDSKACGSSLVAVMRRSAKLASDFADTYQNRFPQTRSVRDARRAIVDPSIVYVACSSWGTS